MSRYGLGTCEVCKVTKATWDLCVDCNRHVCGKCSSDFDRDSLICRDCKEKRANVEKLKELEERVKALEEKLDKTIKYFTYQVDLDKPLVLR